MIKFQYSFTSSFFLLQGIRTRQQTVALKKNNQNRHYRIPPIPPRLDWTRLNSSRQIRPWTTVSFSSPVLVTRHQTQSNPIRSYLRTSSHPLSFTTTKNFRFPSSYEYNTIQYKTTTTTTHRISIQFHQRLSITSTIYIYFQPL